MKKYTALIIDLRESRKYDLKERREIQEYIMDAVSILNKIFRKALEKDVTFSAGDEVQGLFSSVEAGFLYFRLFSMLVAPIEIRAGIGVGNWDIRIKHAGTTAQDGEAYHNARKAIEATEESMGYTVLIYSGLKDDIIVNSLFNSIALIINKQSEYQNAVMLLSELLYPISIYNLMDTSYFKMLIELVAHKHERLRLDFLFVFKETDVFESDDNFFIINGKIRGLPLQLAEIFNVSRQSMASTIKSANIFEARNLVIATLRYLDNWGI